MKKIIAAFIAVIMAAFLIISICFVAVKEDRSYTPSSFDFTGGTGRVTISCPRVTVSGKRASGKTASDKMPSSEMAMADLVFDSEYYDYVKVDGKKYDTTISEGTSTVTIPVNLNSETRIFADTIRMSEPHEIEYVLHV